MNQARVCGAAAPRCEPAAATAAAAAAATAVPTVSRVYVVLDKLMALLYM